MRASIMQRAVSTVALVLVGWQIGSLVGSDASQPRNAVLGIVIGGIAGFLLAPLVVAGPYEALRRQVGRMPPGDLLFAIVGLVLGLVVAALLSYPLSLLPWRLGHILPAIGAALFGYLGIAFMLMRRRELTQWVQGRLGD